jgi:hypothetical protein
MFGLFRSLFYVQDQGGFENHVHPKFKFNIDFLIEVWSLSQRLQNKMWVVGERR